MNETTSGVEQVSERSPAAEAMFARLSCGLGRRDEVPNVEVGRAIAEVRDSAAVATLVELLDDPDASSSAIKALYECGYRAPELLVDHTEVFCDLLRSKKNRLVWGAMIALWCVAKVEPGRLWQRRDEIKAAFAKGSAITQEAAVLALAEVAGSSPERSKELSRWFLEALLAARPKDVPGWLPAVLPVLVPGDAHKAKDLAESILPTLKPTAQKKLRKLLDA